MVEDPLDFLDEVASSSDSKQEDPLDFLDKPTWKDKKLEFTKEVPKGRGLLPDIVTSGTAVAGGLGDVASIVTGENPFTSESLRKKAFEWFPSLAPKNEEEKKWDEGLSLVMGLAAPAGPFKAAGKLFGKGASKVTPFLKSKYRELYDIGKNIGVPEKALAPFKHGKVTETVLKQAAKLGEEAQEGIKFAENLATPMYQELSVAGSKIPLNSIVVRGVTRGLSDVIKDIQKSPGLVKESKEVINVLNEAIQKIKSNPDINVENLMALQKQLGKSVNWDSVKQAGKGYLVQKSRDVVMQGIYGMNPRLGERFSGMDKLVSGYKKLAKEVSPSKLLEFASKGGPVGYALISFLTGHDFGESAMKGAGLYFGKKALGKISAKLLTDPKWVGMKEKIVNVIKNESYDKIPKILAALKKKSDMHRRELDPLDFVED